MSNVGKASEPQNRPITDEERSLIDWLLNHGVPGAEKFLPQVDSLVVVSRCTCGCPTVDFSASGEAVPHESDHILADYLASVDGQDVGVILFQRGGRLISLEVYSTAGSDKPFGLPKIETLHPFANS